MTSPRGRAVVLGAGVAGLLAAAVLADGYEQVSVVERDELLDDGTPRRGAPQGRHAHVLLFRGQTALDQLLPGLTGELVRAGAVVADPGAEHHLTFGGRTLLQQPSADRAVQASRPLLERLVHDRVRALPNVALLPRRDALGVLAGDRVTGVRVADRRAGGEVRVLPADLVADATGTAGCAARLAGVPADRVRVDVGYASRRLRLPEGALAEKAVVVGPSRDAARGMVLTAVEHGWLLTLGGVGAANRPPARADELAAFARTVAPPHVAAALDAAPQSGDVATYRFPADVRHRYDLARDLPAGLVAVGDALQRTNPLYGQGVTTAALAALALRDCLAAPRDELAARYPATVARVLRTPWRMAVTADLGALGCRSRRSALARAYLAAVQATAARDAATATRLRRVVGLAEPPTALLRPSTLARVVAR